jgi:hypothetical protein
MTGSSRKPSKTSYVSRIPSRTSSSLRRRVSKQLKKTAITTIHNQQPVSVSVSVVPRVTKKSAQSSPGQSHVEPTQPVADQPTHPHLQNHNYPRPGTLPPTLFVRPYCMRDDKGASTGDGWRTRHSPVFRRSAVGGGMTTLWVPHQSLSS